MVSVLEESQTRGSLPTVLNMFRRSAQRKYDEEIAWMRGICEEMIAHRRKNPLEKKDLLNAMIHGKDPKTGCYMTDESIVDNILTFLVAGHETTSGLLSFVFYLLIKNPAIMNLAREEVDKVLGTGPITPQHMNQFPYLEAILKETLRLYPTAPAIAMAPVPETTEYPIFLAGGKYQLNKGDNLLALLVKIQKDPLAFGDDAEEWKPERMLEENFAKLPPNSWKPFGNGARTCEALAQSLARVAGTRGFEVRVDPLDSATDDVPKSQPLIIICPSYEGQPPDNAAQFFGWLEKLKDGKSLQNVEFTVFGVGNRDWTSTFHKVPMNLDRLLAANGGTRIAALGLGDVAKGDIFNDFDYWQDNVLWPAIQGSGSSTKNVVAELDLEIDTSARSQTLRQDLQGAVVLSNKILTALGVPEKRHIEIQLPKGMNYTAGEYLAILPTNSQTNVRRVLKRFGLPADAMITIRNVNAGSTLPATHPVSVTDLLSSYVELNQPATKRNIQVLASLPTTPSTRTALLALTTNTTTKNTPPPSLLTLLETHPTLPIPFQTYISLLPPLRTRQYSISSSPLATPDVVSITFSILPSGVASTYLATLEPDDIMHIAVKPTILFTLPEHMGKTPIIMIGAGAGIAPFLGFLQERAALLNRNSELSLAPAWLFLGCRAPEQDALFADELRAYEDAGVVRVYYAYSQEEGKSRGCRYVQDRVWAERGEIGGLIRGEGKILVCGGQELGEGVKGVVRRIYGEGRRGDGKADGIGEEDVERWFDGLKGKGRGI
ncbi:putative Bifunctional P-450:NADPH-P450 reductase [Glarea lozoyensis 74030]|uniref:Putative Bifunctional P-450:NADPH-P450 reductase n=1 Tax=Glarea lozoyensis (strain ATCC 74030 / MF5533) TaxID=1104152 RepID=H0EDJ6_GLAL7|nr:putative Bifunctional P-450:NADPH-P450 reductase [Glarea lozoyensis 74030]